VEAKKGAVAIDVEGLGEIKRQISPSGSTLQVADWAGTLKVQQDLLYQKLGADADLIAALLNVSQFISLPAKDQKEMLFQLARPEISVGHLMSAVNDWAESQGAGNLLDELRSLIQLPETVGPDWLDQAYKLIFSARTEAKKDRDTALGRVEGMTDTPQDLPPLDQLPELEAQIAELKAKMDGLAKKAAAVEAAEGRRIALARREKDISGDLEGLRKAAIDAPAEDADTIRAELEDLGKKLDKAHQESHEAQGEIRAIDDALPKLKKASGACPLAPELVKCTMTEGDRKALTKDLGARRKQLVATHEKIMGEAASFEKEKTELSQRLITATGAESNIREIANLEAQLEETQKELEALPEPVGSDLVSTEIDSLAERVRTGYELAARMKVAAESSGRAQQAKEKATDAVARVARLEALVTLFGPTGIKAKLLSSTMGAVIDRANANLQALTGGAYTADALADPDFHILVTRSDQAIPSTMSTVELRQLSTSERMRVGIAFAESLAHASGLRLLVIDDLEVLDESNRGLLTSWLLGKLGEHDTIIVLSTAETVADPGIEGVSTFWVDGGQVERVGEKVRV
jgi:hypothetical protein